MPALIILAGGKSARMGRNKALLPVGDRPLIQCIYDRLRPLFDEAVISANDRAGYPALEGTWVADAVRDTGALCGMQAALQAMRSDQAFVIGCDMPQANLELVRYLMSLASTADAVVPRIEGRPEPTYAVYAKVVVPAIERQLRARRYKIAEFFDHVRVRYVDEDELRRFDPELQSFTDLDTPEAYERFIRTVLVTGGRPMPAKTYTSFKSFSYLEPGVDYRAFRLAADVGRVPAYEFPLSADQQQRVDQILERYPVISLHDHTSIATEDAREIFEYRRQGRDWTGYAGLAVSRLDAVFENFMDGTALITSKAGWKWDDIIWDLGMRFSDLAHQALVFRAETVADVLGAKQSGRIALIPALEAATPIENEIDRVDILYGLGVRCMGITYSEANALGCGLREKTDGGLTQFGRQVVRRMNQLGMAVDVAHSGDQTSLDTIAASTRPIFITHAGARALWNSPRMKPDAVIKACAEKGGVIGIEAAPHTTLTEEHREHSLESVMAHVAYCTDLVGIGHVALGPDTLFGDHVGLHHAFAAQLSVASIQSGLSFPRVAYVKGMENPAETMPNAVKWLVKHGYRDEDIAKVIGGNIVRVLRETWWR